MEMKNVVAASLLSGAAIAAGAYLLHDGLALESANARIAGCSEQSQAHNPACANVVAQPGDSLDKSSIETVIADDGLEELAGTGFLVLGAAGLALTGHRALE